MDSASASADYSGPLTLISNKLFEGFDPTKPKSENRNRGPRLAPCVLKQDRTFILAAVEHNGLVLQYVPDEFRNIPATGPRAANFMEHIGVIGSRTREHRNT